MHRSNNPEEAKTVSQRLRVAQVAWVVFFALALVLYSVGAILYFGNLRQICTAPPIQCAEYDFPTALGAAQLNAAGMSLDTYAFLRVGFRVLFSLFPITLAALIFARRRSEPMALFVSFFLIFGLTGEATGVLGDKSPVLLVFAKLIEYLSVIFLPLFFGLFPNGRMVPRVYWLVVVFFGAVYYGGEILHADPVSNPIWSVLSYAAWLSVLVGGTAAQIYRYVRVSTSEEKRQTRWVLFGLAVMAFSIVALVLFAQIGGDPDIGTNRDTNLPRRFAFLVVLNIPFEIVYLAIGMAILRSRLFDIDVIIRRTATYAIVVALLLFVYFGSVILLQQLFASVTGQRSEIITIVSTLAIAALFVPLRNRIQNALDKRFNRQRYNAQQVLQEFAVTVRDETNLEKLSAELVNVVNETMQPKSVSLWLKQEHGKK